MKYDIALVLIRHSDFAAAQWARHEQLGANDPSASWRSLKDEHIELADDLGKKAADGVLSLFVGAGVSRPLGFPDWLELLNELNDKLEEPIASDAAENLPARAELIEQKLGRELGKEVAPRFATRRHALGHALLAGLQINTMVTTNYDPCLENASASVRTDDAIRVLTRQVAVGGKPWLLKLHGDIQKPRSIVLTTSHYERYTTKTPALRGVVQSLMLTTHMLFVGFGFGDEDFQTMADQVRAVRSLAEGTETKVGTGLTLQPEVGEKFKTDLRILQIGDGSDLPEAARVLEIMLDRMAYTAVVEGDGRASYLLDPEFEEGATEDDARVRDALLALQEKITTYPKSSAGPAVDVLLKRLGANRH